MPDVVHFLTGSVSRRVAMHAPCSVLAVKNSIDVSARVMVGIDGSPMARAAVECLLRLPLPREVRVTAVGVVPPMPFEATEESAQHTRFWCAGEGLLDS